MGRFTPGRPEEKLTDREMALFIIAFRYKQYHDEYIAEVGLGKQLVQSLASELLEEVEGTDISIASKQQFHLSTWQRRQLAHIVTPPTESIIGPTMRNIRKLLGVGCDYA